MKKEKSHFEDVEVKEPCRDPEHNPPTHLLIPPGKKYIHICPTCGERIIIFSQSPSY